MSRHDPGIALADDLVSGSFMFAIKYAVQSLDDELAKVKKQTVAEQHEIRVLHAEWSYLTQPERLAELNRRFLSLAPIATKQLQQNVAEIPLRQPCRTRPPSSCHGLGLAAAAAGRRWAADPAGQRAAGCGARRHARRRPARSTRCSPRQPRRGRPASTACSRK